MACPRKKSQRSSSSFARNVTGGLLFAGSTSPRRKEAQDPWGCQPGATNSRPVSACYGWQAEEDAGSVQEIPCGRSRRTLRRTQLPRKGMTGKPDDIERVTSGLVGGRRKRSPTTTSLAAYPTQYSATSIFIDEMSAKVSGQNNPSSNPCWLPLRPHLLSNGRTNGPSKLLFSLQIRVQHGSRLSGDAGKQFLLAHSLHILPTSFDLSYYPSSLLVQSAWMRQPLLQMPY